ncbi:secretin N-terminal domain-containing protein [Planctomycetota bacterium]
MTTKITMKIIAVTLVFSVLTTFLSAAEMDKDTDFDPFGSDQGQVITSTDKHDYGPIIPQIEFNNNDISMAFQIISDATGWSIFPTSKVSKAKVSLWAKDVSASDLLDTVVTLAGFTYYRKDNVITVMTYDEYRQYHGLAKEVFTLNFSTAASVNASIKPFLTKLGKSIVHKETNTIILYEAQANLKSIAAVIEKLDSPSEEIVIEIVNLKYADCENLAKILQSVFSSSQKLSRNKSQGESNGRAKNAKEPAAETITIAEEQTGIYAIKHSNQLVVVGTDDDIEKIRRLVATVDIHIANMVLEVIELKYADSDMLAETLQKLFQDDKPKTQNNGIKASPQNTNTERIETAEVILSPRSNVYIQSIGRSNQLIIKAFKTDMEQIREFISQLDTYVEPITQNYQLTYVDASEIFNGLERILNLNTRNNNSKDRNAKSQGITLIEKTNSILLTGPPSAHRIMTSIVEKMDKPGTYEAGMIRIYKLENADVEEVAKTVSDLIQTNTNEKDNTPNVKFAQNDPATSGHHDMAKTGEFISRIEGRVSVNKATNSIVVQATARQHRELEKLIEELDTRRRQVLIEAMIVEVTNTDNFNLGVELSHASLDAAAFSAFGLSSGLDPIVGTRDITVSPGGTAAVLRPDKVQAIIQALKQDGKARITSAPRILVNDNAVGFINSIAEEPTTQTNQGETTTTTSFAGFVEAGTQFAITPHISENDYLRIEYQITLNSFGTKPTDPSIPPPRNTSSIQSEATVPAGFTIVVGGLQTSDESENVDKVPFLGDIPILEWVFKNTRIEKQYKTTYLFITPHIMKKDNFEDLKEVSKKALEEIEPNSKEKN